VIDPAKTVGVYYVFTDGGGGRDLSNIAGVRDEAEVLLLPGVGFEVISVQKLDAKVQNTQNAATHVDTAVKRGKPLPTSWYEVRLRLTQSYT